ncbi:MAG: metal ABC transporter solute-binding protein, Zn/Mn family, partial [Veillonella parvula]
MIKKLILLVVGIMMAALFAGCGNDAPNAQKEQASKKIQVVTSFNAMAEFTKAIGGDKVEVSTIIPDGVEPHDFELKPENMKQLATAQVFVYNGFGMEPWAKQAIEAAKNDKLVSVVATEGVEAIKNTDPEEIKEHGAEDPHAWLSLKNAKIEVKNIKDALVKVDPANKDYYEKNYTEYVAKLDAMIKKYEEQFAKAPHKNFVTGHAAFAYLCRDFGLEQNGLKPGFLIGGIAGNFGTSARLGESEFFVIEADEYDTAFFDKRSKFVHYNPKTLIINNISFDHADIFDDLHAIQRQFHHMIRTIPSTGRVLSFADEQSVKETLNMGCWSEQQLIGKGKEWFAERITND